MDIQKEIENIYFKYEFDRNNEDWNNFEVYLKRVWFSNGIHHHYSNAKFTAKFSSEYLIGLLAQTNTKLEGEAFDVIFNDNDAKKLNLSKKDFTDT